MIKNNSTYLVSIDDVFTAMRLARIRGKKPGESFKQELEEVIRKHKKALKYLGSINDPDMIVGNLREEGYFKGTKLLDLTKIGKKK